MRNWFAWFTVVVFLFTLSGCGKEDREVPTKPETTFPTVAETEPPVIELDNLEYWDIVQDEIVDMLRSHNLYIEIISHAYPCVQFYVEPGVVTEDGEIVASGLTQEEYKEVFESVKIDLHMILDKYKIGKPKTSFHGCNSIVEVFFNNWFINLFTIGFIYFLFSHLNTPFYSKSAKVCIFDTK